MLRALCLLFLATFLALPANAQERVYEEGQVWEFEAEAAAEPGTIIIQRIENAADTGLPFDVIHISMLADIPFAGAEQLEVGHLPVSRETLDTSVTQRSDADMSAFAAWEEGYQVWKDDEGGVFTITLSEIVDMLFEMVPQNPGHAGSQ